MKMFIKYDLTFVFETRIRNQPSEVRLNDNRINRPTVENKENYHYGKQLWGKGWITPVFSWLRDIANVS